MPGGLGRKAADLILLGTALALGATVLDGLRKYALYRQSLETRLDALSFAGFAAAMALVSVGLLVSLRARPTQRATFALATASAWVTLFAADRLLTPTQDEKSRLAQEIRRLRAQGSEVLPGVFLPSHFVHGSPPGLGASQWLDVAGRPTLPLASVGSSLAVTCEDDEGWRVYASDEHGFNNPPGLWARRPVEIVAIGDSMTFGYCVPPEQNPLATIRARHPSTLNLGYSGNGPLLELATLREYAPALAPATVLWFFCASNDLRDLKAEMGHGLLMRYLEPDFSQGLLQRQAAINAALAAYLWRALAYFERRERDPLPSLVDFVLLRHVRALGVRAMRTALAGGGSAYEYVTTEEEYALFERVLREAQAVVRRLGGRFLFVYLPSWDETFGAASAGPLVERRRQRILAIAAACGLTPIDVRPAFLEDGRPALFDCPSCHYSPEGYRVVAWEVVERLDREH